MATGTKAPEKSGSKLKVSSGWFAAGVSFQRALTMLSDGAFKLSAYISLEADRATGQFEASQTSLARVLGKSRRIIGVYARELERKAVCCVRAARNRHAPRVFEICEDFWPYRREGSQETSRESDYVARARTAFLSLECAQGPFGSVHERFARELEQRGIPIEMVEDAMAMAAVRKYISWLNNGPSAPIGSLAYLEPVIAEILTQPRPHGYREYIYQKSRKLRGEVRKNLLSGIIVSA